MTDAKRLFTVDQISPGLLGATYGGLHKWTEMVGVEVRVEVMKEMTNTSKIFGSGANRQGSVSYITGECLRSWFKW